MKKILFTALVLCLSGNIFAQNTSNFGEKITSDGAISTTELAEKVKDNEKITTKIQGTVESVCQVKGCWMKLKLDDGKTMRVTFKDYGFFMPLDIVGKNVVLEGVAEVKTTSVKMLQHYAEDAGKSKKEIKKITEPEKALTFVANGVLIE